MAQTIRFLNDIYYSALNSTGATANTSLCLQTSTGRIGIGTTSPSTLLNLANPAVSSISMTFTSNDGTLGDSPQYWDSARIVAGWDGSDTAWDKSFFRVQTHSTNTTAFTDDFTIKGGRIGIGTTSPQAPLHTTCNSASATTVATFENLNITNTTNKSFNIQFYGRDINNTQKDLGAITMIPTDGNFGYSAMAFSVRGPFGAGSSEAVSEVMRFTRSGTTPCVGVGLTSPLAPLHTYFATSGIPDTTGSGTSNVATRFQVGSVCLDMGIILNGNMWLQNHLNTAWNTTYPILLNPNGGNVGIGTTSPGAQLTVQNSVNQVGALNTFQCLSYSGSQFVIAQDPGNANLNSGWNGAQLACLFVGKATGSGRSISAAGTLNASGADYAEYMTKTSDFTIKKGDVIGVNAQGLLTNVFRESVTFIVKSTDPCMVGGDTWGTEEALGLTKPKEVKESEEGYAEYQTTLTQFNAKLEEARARVDRIAFAGQVPVNVLGATPGQYIIPMANDDGSISGQAVSSPTMDQYMAAVGKVIKVLPDGRAQIIVKVV